MANKTSIQSLTTSHAAVKRRFLEMYRKADAGHVGAALSCAEMLSVVRFAWMDRFLGDELILSKGHAAAALYAVLAEAGDLDPGLLDTFYQDGTLLSAHPPPGGIRGIPFATGSLGHGLGLGAGMALGMRWKGNAARVFCITSDGELNEGSTWEAALFLAQHRLTNVVWLVDRNGIQGFGRTEDVLALEPLVGKLRSFGFYTVEADGHSLEGLLALDKVWENRDQPTVIVCHTVKGKGMGALENTVDCHYRPMSAEQYAELSVLP